MKGLFSATRRPTWSSALVSGLWLCGVAGLLWILYQCAFDAPFYLDTHRHLLMKDNLHLEELTVSRLWQAVHLDHGERLYRPLSSLSLALTHYLFGLTPGPYRVGNLAIHLLATGALFFLFTAVLRSSRVAARHPWLQDHAPLVAVLAASLWALHPVQTNVVTYVIQRMASLSGLFTFLAVGAWLRARGAPGGWNGWWGSLAGAAFFLTLASKENAVVVVPLVLAAEWLLLAPPGPRFPRRAARVALWATIAALGVLAAWKGPRYWVWLAEISATRDFTPLERLLTQIRIQSDYLTVLLVPDPRLLTLDADVPLSRGLLDPPATLAMLLAVALALGCAVTQRRRYPLLSFCILWFFLAQLIESTVLPLELYFEHRMYVPSAFLWLGVCAVGASWCRTPSWRRVVLVTGCAGLLAAEAAGTYARNLVWASPLAFGADQVAKAPTKPRPRVNFGYALRLSGQFDAAEEQLREALALGGDSKQVHLNLAGIAYAREDYAQARLLLERALAAAASAGDRAEVHQEWAAVEIESGDQRAAFSHLKSALGERPRDARSWELMGRLLLEREDWRQAERAYREALRIDPARASALYGLGRIAEEQGDYSQAALYFARAAQKAPLRDHYQESLERTKRLAGGQQDAPAAQ